MTLPAPPAPPAPPASDAPETPQETAATASGRHPWTLQKRLIVTIIAIVSLILVFVAVTMSAILGSVLEDRLAEQVRSNVERTKIWVSQEVQIDPSVEAADLLERMQGMQVGPGILLGLETVNGVTAAVMTDTGVVALSDTQLADFIAGVSAERGPDAAVRSVAIPGVGGFQVGGSSTGNAIVVVGLSRSDVAGTIAQMLTVIGLLTAGGLVLLVGATAWTIRAGLKPLRAVADTASRVARQPLDQGAVTISERVPAAEADPRTEVGRVGAALNTLLDHVDTSLDARQRNEERMRRFVADASHELRTPLASIRGYSELSLRALGQFAPEQAAETTEQSLERIQAQSVRMTGIVEDLLLLARLDEGQELVYGSVDLTRLMIDAVGDAQVAGPEHEWTIVVDEVPVQIAGDAGRLHQVLANLLANARIHTPAGTAVGGSVAIEGDDAVLRVHDDGPGIPPAVQGELFERFARADVSRARQTGGSGLGLSIARAIVEAHHGEITVDSRPGDTTFTVRLPLRPRPGP